MVDASVPQDQLVWVYHIQRLWFVYATALAVTAACGVVGLACILKNGEDSDLTFWDIVRATRNSELDAVVEGEKRGDTGKGYDATVCCSRKGFGCECFRCLRTGQTSSKAIALDGYGTLKSL